MRASLSMRTVLACAGALALLNFGAGCARFPGPPVHAEEDVRPDEVADFSKLYGTNCAACHGAQGNNGPSIALNNAVYQAFVPDDQLLAILTRGRGNMPAFAQSAGGMLTDKQISILVYGMRQRWAKPGYLEGANVPATEPPNGRARAAILSTRTTSPSCLTNTCAPPPSPAVRISGSPTGARMAPRTACPATRSPIRT